MKLDPSHAKGRGGGGMFFVSSFRQDEAIEMKFRLILH